MGDWTSQLGHWTSSIGILTTRTESREWAYSGQSKATPCAGEATTVSRVPGSGAPTGPNLSTVPPCFGQTAMKVGGRTSRARESSGRLRRYWTEQGAPMHSTLTAKPSDDPHDVVVVAPDAIRVAPSDDEISDLLQQAARHRSDTQTRAAASDFAAGAMVPEVDTTSFRAASVNDVPAPGEHRSMARRALRGIIALLLAASFGAAAIAWKGYGDVAIRQIAKLTTQIVLVSSLTSEKPALAVQPEPAAVPADAANTVSPQPAPAAQTAAEAAAPAA